MSDQTALLIWVGRQNIERYWRLMQTELTPTERAFIERRICEEEAALRGAGALVEVLGLAPTGVERSLPPHPLRPAPAG